MTSILKFITVMAVFSFASHGVASPSSSSSSSSSLSAIDGEERLRTLLPVPQDKAFPLDGARNIQAPTLNRTMGHQLPPSSRNILHFSIVNQSEKTQNVLGYGWKGGQTIHLCLMLGGQRLSNLGFSTPIPMPHPLPQGYTVSDVLSDLLKDRSLDSMDEEEPFPSVLQRLDADWARRKP